MGVMLVQQSHKIFAAFTKIGEQNGMVNIIFVDIRQVSEMGPWTVDLIQTYKHDACSLETELIIK